MSGLRGTGEISTRLGGHRQGPSSFLAVFLQYRRRLFEKSPSSVRSSTRRMPAQERGSAHTDGARRHPGHLDFERRQSLADMHRPRGRFRVSRWTSWSSCCRPGCGRTRCDLRRREPRSEASCSQRRQIRSSNGARSVASIQSSSSFPSGHPVSAFAFATAVTTDVRKKK
jgi:hypothetical protein